MSRNSKSYGYIPQLNKLSSFKKIDSDLTTEMGSNNDTLPTITDLEDEIIIQSSPPKPKIIESLDKVLMKLGQFGLTTSNGDKMVRMCTSVVKIMKCYSLIKDTQVLKNINKLNAEMALTRKVFRFNSKWSSMKQICQLTVKPTKTKMDNFNLIFKLYQLVSDIIDEVVYLIDIKVYQLKQKNMLEKTSNNMYFIQCLTWLILHSYQCSLIRNKIRLSEKPSVQLIKEHTFKLLTILKYVFDSFTSHNQFSYKIFNSSPKLVAAAGLLSSIIGLRIAWK